MKIKHIFCRPSEMQSKIDEAIKEMQGLDIEIIPNGTIMVPLDDHHVFESVFVIGREKTKLPFEIETKGIRFFNND